MHVSIGRLRLPPGSKRLRFLWYGALAYLQAKRAPDVVHASVRREGSHTLWSLSVWASPHAMLAYRNSGSHLRAMQIARELNAQVEFKHWQADGVPTMDEAIYRLKES